jgi:hypothetical protein
MTPGTSDQTLLPYALAGLIIIAVWGKFSDKSPLVIGAAVVGLIAAACGAIWPLLATLWFGLAATLLGRFLLHKLGTATDSWEINLLIGAGFYGTAVGLLAHLPASYPGIYGAALILPIVLGRRTVQSWFGTVTHWLFRAQQPYAVANWWLDVTIAGIALMHFSVALMPEIGHDALAMHLFVPSHLAQRHQWGFDVGTYVWAVMPMLGDWIFSIVYMLAGETAARFTNVGFIFLLAYLVRELVLWAGGNAVGARWAVLLFLVTPLTFTESNSLFIESIWAAFVIAGSLSAFRLIQTNDAQKTHIISAGILFGFAVAAKAITFTILPVLLLLLILRYRSWLQWHLTGPIAMALTLCIAVGSIAYITAWWITGNPVFPFFNRIFQSPFFPPTDFDSAEIFGRGLHWNILYDMTFHTHKFLESRPGGSGFQWLILLVPALLTLLFLRRWRGAMLFAVAGLSVALTFQSVTYLRYVFPAFVWATAGIGAALSLAQSASSAVRRNAFIVASAVIFLNFVYFKSATYYGNLSWKALISPNHRDDYIEVNAPLRSAVKLVNQLNTAATPVAFFSQPLGAGLEADSLYPNWYNHQFEALIMDAGTPQAIAEALLLKGVDYVVMDMNWGTADKRTIVEAATAKISNLNSISVRRVKDEFRYQTELITSSDFSAPTAWSLTTETRIAAGGGVKVSVAAPASQVVAVVAGRRYLYSAVLACAGQPGQGRLQVNWLGAESKFIGTDIQVYDCTESGALYSMEVVAPAGATTGIVYATGHTDVPVIFRRVSLKQ